MVPFAIAAGAAAVLLLQAFCAVLGRRVQQCAICAKPVRETRANHWTHPNRERAYTHLGACNDEYAARHFGNDYRAGEGT
jgi:hypothetical protein